MTFDAVLKNIELSEIVFRDIILSTNYQPVTKNILSWKNYSPGIFKNLYAKEYEQLVRNMQYSFLLKDNLGFIQFYYEFSDDVIKKIKLCYYPYPVKLREETGDYEAYFDDSDDEIIGEYYYDIYTLLSHQFQLSLDDDRIKELIQAAKDAGNYENDEEIILESIESKYAHTNSSHFRIDYDANVKSHHKCEIQVGAVNEIRLPMQKIITPFTFCDFLFKRIALKKYKSIVSKSTYASNFTNSLKQSIVINPFEENNIFLKHG